MEERFKNLYQTLLSNKELKFVMKNAKGNWEEDKKRFIRIQKDMEDLAGLTEVDVELL
jgi:hypothetical protein